MIDALYNYPQYVIHPDEVFDEFRKHYITFETR